MEQYIIPQAADIAAAVRETLARGAAMSREVAMPQLGFTMVEGTVAQWLKAEGERVARGEPLMEITSEKATVRSGVPSGRGGGAHPGAGRGHGARGGASAPGCRRR